MDNQKIENQLNLALDATPEEQLKSQNLGVGYDPQEKSWELIIKYSGDMQRIAEVALQVTELTGGYGVIRILESQIPLLTALPQVEYIEKPKRLFFSRVEGKRSSCMTAVQRPPLSLNGRGILVAVLDSGVDYRHPEFLKPDGSTRIVAIWDQMAVSPKEQNLSQGGSFKPPAGFSLGVEYTEEMINDSLEEGTVLTRDISGHGTGVLAIAAGNQGVAYESNLLVVKLGRAEAEGFPRTTQLMLGLEYVVRKARKLGQPVAINLSFGNNYGSHTGESLLETYMDQLSDQWKSVICVGSGNEGAAAGHTSGTLKPGQMERVEFAIASYERSLSIQIWRDYADEFGISLVSPTGSVVGPFPTFPQAQRYRMGNTEILLYFGTPTPYSPRQEIYIEFLPVGEYLDAGIWSFVLSPERIVDGEWQMWMPGREAIGGATRFLRPVETGTLTIPSTAAKVITVGAYDSRSDTYADFSGRGLPGAGDRKPDLVAPGVNISTAAPDGRYVLQTGTSFAVPFVTGTAALLMQYGITDGNDPYLYGEKVKAYLRKGARPLPAFRNYPNETVGYGALCVRDSLPV